MPPKRPRRQSSLDEVIRAQQAEQTSYFVPHSDFLFHAAFLSTNPEMEIKRWKINPDDENPSVNYKLHRPHDPSFNKAQDFQTCLVSELGPRISSMENMAIQTDMVKCPDITEPFIMFNMLLRFLRDDIYTSIGDILICVNPFKPILGLYDNERVMSIKEQPDIQDMSESPHVFEMANSALNGLTYKNKTQAIVISGESGAGKTEQTKKCLQFYSHSSSIPPAYSKPRSASIPSSDSISNRILSANPILEAFGNAKTVRNNNSSRFGKFMKIRFRRINSAEVVMVGCHTDHYLLEKARLTSHSSKERTFHIFYQLLSGGLDKALQEKMQLDDKSAHSFEYLAQGETEVDNVDDAEELKVTLAAFKDLGFEDSEVESLFVSLAAILFLGNIAFFETDSDGTMPQDHSIPDLNACGLLTGIDPDRLAKALSTKERTVRAETIISPLNEEQSINARDALAKATYGAIFDWIMAKVNESMKIPVRNTMTPFIGILDIFGFEIFEENSFEQLCINYCNEKLQKHFVEQIIKKEEAMCRKEELEYEPSQIVDNTDVLELIEEPRVGLLAILDEECKVSKGSDKGFISKITKAFSDKKRFKVDVHFKESEFMIHHYAGSVKYETTCWLERNKDELSDHLEQMMVGCRNDFFKNLFADKVDKKQKLKSSTAAGHKLAHNTESSEFIQQLNTLADALDSSQPHFIRCIKPNSKKEASLVEPDLIREQLRYSGVLDAVKIRKQGFPFRPTHKEFWKRYWSLVPNFDATIESENSVDDDERCLTLLTLLQQLKLEGEQSNVFQIFEYGRTRIFYRTEQHELLEGLRRKKRAYFAILIQKFHRGKVGRRRHEMLTALRKTMYYFVEEFKKRAIFKSSEVDTFDSTLSVASDNNLNCHPVKEASRVLLVLKLRDDIRQGAIDMLRKLPTCTEETIQVLSSIKDTISYAVDNDMGDDRAVQELQLEAKNLEKYSAAQHELEESSTAFDKFKINEALQNVQSMETTLNRNFCNSAKAVAAETLQEIAEEEKNLKKLVDMIIHPDASALNAFPFAPGVTSLVEQANVEKIKTNLAPLENEICSWESSMPRSVGGINLVHSARLTFDMRTAIIEDSLLADEIEFLDTNRESLLKRLESDPTTFHPLPTRFDSYLEMLSPTSFAIDPCVESELSFIQLNLAKQKYLPTIKENLKMPVAPGPLGEMDISDVPVETFEDIVAEAKTQDNLLNDELSKEIVDQAHAIIKIRKHWKSSEWDSVVSCTAKTSLPYRIDWIQDEVSWARLEAQDKIVQNELRDLIKEGAMEKDANVPVVKYNHIEEYIKNLQHRRSSILFSSMPSALSVGGGGSSLGSASFDEIDPVTGSPKSKGRPLPQNIRSAATLDVIDTALLTIELRKLQDAGEWGAVLALFKEDISTKEFEKLEPSKSRRRRSMEISGAIGKAGANLRSALSSGQLEPSEPPTPKVVSRYPRAYLTEEMEAAQSDAAHRIVKLVLSPAMYEGGAKGTIGQVDTSKVSIDKLEAAIKQANELPLHMDGNAQELIEDAKLLYKFRKTLKKNKKDQFTKSFAELEKLADKYRMPKGLKLSTPNDKPSGSGRGPRPGEEELDLLVGEVRYIQVKQDVPQILKTGAAGDSPGKTDFSTIDYQGLNFTIDAINALQPAAKEMEDLQILSAGVKGLRDTRMALQDADEADQDAKFSKWESADRVIGNVLKSGLIDKLPENCKKTVEEELIHAKSECIHQRIQLKAEKTLRSGRMAGNISEANMESVDLKGLEETLNFANKVGLQTEANKKSIEAVEFALNLRKLQKEKNSGNREELKALLYSDMAGDPKALLLKSLVEEIDFAKDVICNAEATELIEKEIADGKIEKWTPGLIEKQDSSVHEGLRNAILDARRLERDISSRTKAMVEAGSIVSSIRQLIFDKKNYDEIRKFLSQYMSNSTSFMKALPPKVYHHINNEVHLADCHIKVMELADRMYGEALVNKVAIRTHLEKVGESKEFGTLKDEVGQLDMSKVSVESMSRAVSESFDLLKRTGKDHQKMPAPYFRELVDVCDSLCTLRKHLKEDNYAGVKNCLFDQDKKNKFIDKKEVDSKKDANKTDQSNEENLKKRHKLYIVYNQERIIARQENNDHQIQQLFQRALGVGGVSGEVGNVDYSHLSITELQSCNQQVAQLRPRTPHSIELQKIAGVVFKIRVALRQEPRDWNLVKSELDQLKKVVKGKIEDHDVVSSEISLVQQELDNVRIVNILSTALTKGWDKNSAVGDLKISRIDSEGLALAIRQVSELGERGQSKDAKELLNVASMMREIRSNLRHCLDIGGDGMKQQEESEAWLLVGENIDKMEQLQQENPNGKGVKVTKLEVARVRQELNLYDASQGIVYALFQGSHAHVQKEIEKDVATIEPHIQTLEAAIKDAVNAKVENPKLTVLLKNANSILKIRKSLLKAAWNDVENECITFSLSQNINEHAKVEIDLTISEAHNQIVYMSLERCLHSGGATGEIGMLHLRDIKVNGFQRGFEIAEEKANSSYDLRPQVQNLYAWAKLIYELRTAQRVSNPNSRSSKHDIDVIIDKMISERDKQGGFVEKYIEDEYSLAVDDSMFREMKTQFEKRMRRGQAKEAPISLAEQSFSKVKSLGNIVRDSIMTDELETLIEDMKDSEYSGLDSFIDTARIVLKLRQAQLEDNIKGMEKAIGEAVGGSGGSEFWGVLPEAQKEMKLAMVYLKDHNAHKTLRSIFEENGSFNRRDDDDDNDHAERTRRKSLTAGKEVTVGRKYSMEATKDDHINFETVDIAEIDDALKKAGQLTLKGRSKEVAVLMKTAKTVGDMRRAMKSGDWPMVAEIINNLDEKNMHILANREIGCIKGILNQRQFQKLLLEGLKKGAPACVKGFVDSSTSETGKLEDAVRRSEKKGTEGGELGREVHWLRKSCIRVAEIRSLIKQLEFRKALQSAEEASKAFEEETGHYDTEWKHYVADELERYQTELTKKQVFVNIVGDIQRATGSCDVDQLKLALLEAKEAKLEECPDLGMRRAVVHAKRILKETSMVEKILVEEGLKMCNQKKLEASLRRAEELNLSTEVTEHCKEELRKLKELRRRLAKAICFMKRDEMGKVLALTRRMEEENKHKENGGEGLQRASYSKMKNFSSVEFLHELPVDVSTYLQLELAKMNAAGGGDLDDLVDLTVRIKEKVFASKANQANHGDLKTFIGLRDEEDFARHRMITDSSLVKGMLSFTRKAIPTSLTKLPTNLSSLAVRLFRQNILGWLGTRRFSHPHVLLQQILKVCSKIEGVRDEVFCQILKQMKGCDEVEIKCKLWGLLKLCLGCFPPSNALENYVEFFLLKNGRSECVEVMHKCIIGWRIKKELNERGMRDQLRNVERFVSDPAFVGKEEIEKAVKFYIEEVDFERGIVDGQDRLEELALFYSNNEWRKRFMMLSLGKTTVNAEGLLEGLNKAKCSFRDLRDLRFLVCGDLAAAREVTKKEELDDTLVKEDLLEYIASVHNKVMEKVKGKDSYVARKSHTWQNCTFDIDWFKGAIKFARSQIHRINNKLCGKGGSFHRIAHTLARQDLVAEHEMMTKKARMQDEIDNENENAADDEVAVVRGATKGKAKKKTALVARKLSSGATQVVGSMTAIKVPNKFKIEDMQRTRNNSMSDESSPKNKRNTRKRTSSVELLEQGSDDEISDMDFEDDDEDDDEEGVEEEGEKEEGEQEEVWKNLYKGSSFEIVDVGEVMEKKRREKEEGEKKEAEELPPTLKKQQQQPEKKYSATNQKWGGATTGAVATAAITPIKPQQPLMDRPILKKKSSGPKKMKTISKFAFD